MTTTLVRHAPDVDYQTRDYEGFRRLLIALLKRSGSAWTERAAADAGIMLVEALANRLDLLAYAGDRVAEEAYLGTARQWESVRRHAALGDHWLDRGNATRGDQHFELRKDKPANGEPKKGEPYSLPAGTRVAPWLAPNEDPEQRLIVETTEDAELDNRRNSFALERSVGAGSNVLHLLGADGARVDLRSIGLARRMRLALVDRDHGEIVTIARVQGGAVELEHPLQGTYLAGSSDRTAKVLGNLVPIRQGRCEGWERVGQGGAAVVGQGDTAADEVRAEVYFTRRIDQLRGLKQEAEAARSSWIDVPDLVSRWELANTGVCCVVHELRELVPSTRSDEEVRKLQQRLATAAEHFCAVIEGVGLSVPDALRPSDRVTLPNQRIEIEGDDSVLWFDDEETLSMRVDFAGKSIDWTEVPDFLRSGPDDPHYVVELAEDRKVMKVTLRFGDGEHGALLPVGSQVMIRRVIGDAFAGNLGAGSLQVIVGDKSEKFDQGSPTTNPLTTTGARPPEDLTTVEERLRRALLRPAIPVTLADYKTVLEERDDIAEAAVSVVRDRLDVTQGRVDVVIRPAPGASVGQVLRDARAYLEQARLAGTDVWVRLAEPLFISIVVIVDVHPDVRAADLRFRLRRALLESFGDQGEKLLGQSRARSEVYKLIESVAGVVWSQIIGFDLADRHEPAAEETIVPGPHQIIRCLDLPDLPANGSIKILAARRYRLAVELSYPDPDNRPLDADVTALLMKLLSGPKSVPVTEKERWTEITKEKLDDMLLHTDYALSVTKLMDNQRAVDRLPLDEGEVPILDSLQIAAVWKPARCFRLEVKNAAGGPASEKQIIQWLLDKFSGLESVPVQKSWPEITVARLNSVVDDKVLKVLALLDERGRMVESISLSTGQLPLLRGVHFAAPRRPLK